MFSLPPLPPQDTWPPPEDGPWLADTATVLQPKALLPTPRYCQPPPSYRPRPPLFPVPPPGSCLLPPPPLSTCEGLMSPHSWQEATPSKGDRWRKMSWTAGEGGTHGSPPPCPTFYNYHRPAQCRPRTLVEVPLLSQPQPAVLRSDPQPIFPTKQQPTSVLQSNLDPTSRPFTPASLHSLPSSFPPNSYEECASVVSSDKMKLQYDMVDSSSNPFYEAVSEKSFLASNLSRHESFTSQQGSFFADDSLPLDLKQFLPEMDNSVDEFKELFEGKLPMKRKFPVPFPSDISGTILPPPIIPFASHWSGQNRPPLLPTPKNFPPYGPRPVAAPIFEEELPIPPSTFLPRLLPVPTPGTLPTHLYTEDDNLVLSRKPEVVSRMLSQSAALLSPSLQHFNFNHTSEMKSEATTSGKIIRGFPDVEDWDPSFPPAEPSSLLDPHPVPDEYMVAKVIGGKLPTIKLPNCHTDLLLFLFYAWQEDTTQLVAASLLFERGWRYHTVDKVWLARWPGVTPEKKTADWEEGLYQYFDVKVWRRIPGWFRLNYVQLAEKTSILEQEASLQALYTRPMRTA
eukprot:GFUD01016237.1.p1 GENE.GFUD01016237.1~~GFUD01016237.1.p1  ORF type:complete len:568 (-),score=128.32 GFUD01016237.1:232-1935(-)